MLFYSRRSEFSDATELFFNSTEKCVKQICDEVDLLCGKVSELLPSVSSKIAELQPGFGVVWETITQLRQFDNNSGAKLFRGEFRETINRQFDELKSLNEEQNEFNTDLGTNVKGYIDKLAKAKKRFSDWYKSLEKKREHGEQFTRAQIEDERGRFAGYLEKIGEQDFYLAMYAQRMVELLKRHRHRALSLVLCLAHLSSDETLFFLKKKIYLLVDFIRNDSCEEIQEISFEELAKVEVFAKDLPKVGEFDPVAIKEHIKQLYTNDFVKKIKHYSEAIVAAEKTLDSLCDNPGEESNVSKRKIT